ncbi:hypothetical protein BDN70DRAFT_804100 [Pholiota conissans]|uniref:Uncharacterized protein n=1 Tax=Pholiota conissans TaxID=109636 RepID=A0A9P5Z589_9AGAR|nr:hypothetical protein BDN70DRAFT_804100 [Pholiota conissans]
MLKLLHHLLILTRTLLLGEEDTEWTPSSCLQTSTSLEELATCLDTFTVPHDYYTPFTYDLAQPAGSQREGWKVAVQTLLDVDGNCSISRVPLSLQGLYTIEPFRDHCILYEASSQCGTYLKGWGFVVVPSRRSGISRNVHISAPHPGFDLGTVEQAASVYQTTGSRSLLVAGRRRTAFLEHSDCIPRTSTKQNYYKTDPAHNDEEPFFDASIAIHDWQNQHHGCPSTTCAFLQFHGKGTSTCSTDTIFLSSGLGNSSASKAWYLDPTDRPVKRLQQTLRTSFPSSSVSLPSDSSCPLTATKNVVGRYLNGIHMRSVCTMGATSERATGVFVHAEQAWVARDKRQYAAWARAVVAAFDAVCEEGMGVDLRTGLCAPRSLLAGHLETDGRSEGVMGRLVWNPWYLSVCYFMMF